MTIRRLTEEQTAVAAKFSWRLCRKNQTCSYPLLISPDAMTAEYRRSVAHPDGFLAGCYRDGALGGVVCGFAENGNKYLQTTGFYVAEGDGAAASALIAWLAAQFAGYTANVGLPADNATVACVLRKNGYRLLDDALDLRLKSLEFRPVETGGSAAVLVDASMLPQYLEFHQRHFGDCYWNAQRLWERFSEWDVCALMAESRMIGGMFLRRIDESSAEIYGLHAETELSATALLSFAMTDLLARDTRIASVIFMAGAADEASATAALSLGFRQENHYQCYAKVL